MQSCATSITALLLAATSITAFLLVAFTGQALGAPAITTAA